MHIGLIGGIGPAATDAYYRRLVNAMAARGAELQMTIAHADSPVLLGNMAAGNAAAQAEVFRIRTERLAAAGAECVAVTSIAGHFCNAAFQAVSPLPVIDMLAEVDRAVTARGLARVGILGTGTVMRTGFYGALSSAETLAPEGEALDAVHQAYVGIAAVGETTPEQTELLLTAGQALIDRGADAVMLGGTDLALVYDPIPEPYPLVDAVEIHVAALTDIASGQRTP
ncbi:MAG: aspartate/glutamate racemase family protein [Pseudomonadota bacterium]